MDETAHAAIADATRVHVPVHKGSERVVRRAIAGVLLSAVVMLSSGCGYMGNWLRNGFKVGPDYARPAAPIAEDWIDFNDPRVISDRYGVNDAIWWTTFNDPVLNELVQVSYQQNLPLRAAGLRVLEAQAQRAVAAGLLFPQFQQAFGQYQRIQLSRNGNPVGVSALPARAFDFWSTGFNVGWEVDLWGKIRRNLESADAELDASVEGYDDVLVCLIADTAAAYIEMRAFDQRLAYARSNVTAQQGSLRLAEARFRNGAVSELDVTQAKSNLGQTEALIPTLEFGLRDANNRLCVLLGTPPRELLPQFGPGPIPSSGPDVVVGIPADLIRRRPDVREAERNVAAQSALIGVAVADLFPTFSISGSINYQATKFSRLFSSGSNAGFIAPGFNWNILNYGRIVNGIRAQDARFQQAAVNYQQTVLGANAEVENAIIGFLTAQEQVRALQYSVTATQRSVELSMTQYREGLIDFNRVFNLQSALVQQQDDLATAQASVALNLVRIYKTLGGGWQIRLGAGYPAQVIQQAPAEEVEAPNPPAAAPTEMEGQ